MAAVHTPHPPAVSSPTPPGPPRAIGALGLPASTALVIGSIIGTGVFTMPAVMASAGTVSILVLAVISACAVVLGVMFGQLTRRVPTSDGGLYAYTRHEFGDFAGYLTAWCYWITCWAGNAAIVSSWVFYVESLFRIENPSAWVSFGIAMAGLWIPAFINLAGVRQMALFQMVTVVLKFVPLLLIGLLGWFWVSASSFPVFNASGGSLFDAISAAAGVALFSFIGVETASIAAAKVRDPARNVGRASTLGTASAALLYVLVTAAVMGLVPSGKLADNGAPFVDAFQTMFGNGSWVGTVVALVAVISGIGALNGWTLVTAEMPYVAAKEKLFFGPFAKVTASGIPWFGIVVSTAVASLLMAYSYSGSTGLKVFTYLVNLSVVTVAIPYFFSACAQLAYLVSRRRKVHGPRLVRDLGIASLSILFSLWVTAASGYQAVYQALLLVLIGLPIYSFLKASKERAGLVLEPLERDEVVPH